MNRLTQYAYFSPSRERKDGYLTAIYVMPDRQHIAANIIMDAPSDGTLPLPADKDAEFIGAVIGNILIITRGDEKIPAEHSESGSRSRIILNQYKARANVSPT